MKQANPLKSWDHTAKLSTQIDRFCYTKLTMGRRHVPNSKTLVASSTLAQNMHNVFEKIVPKASASTFQSWNVLHFAMVKTTCARLLDADQFTWSQLRFLNENSKDHIWILCANETSHKNKAKLSENLCILEFQPQNAARQLSLRQQCPNVVGLCLNFWSAPHWAVQATIHFTKITNHTVGQWLVLVLQFFCQCCPCWFLFFFDNIRIISVYKILNPWVFGMDKVEPNSELVVVAAGFGLKKAAQH